VATGGAAAAVDGLDGGYFVEPTVISGVGNGMRVVTTEVPTAQSASVNFGFRPIALAIAYEWWT